MSEGTCVHTLDIDALNRKRQQLTQDFKRVQDGYLAAQEAARERGRQERERKVEEKKLKEVEKKSRETLLPRCVCMYVCSVCWSVYTYVRTYICTYDSTCVCTFTGALLYLSQRW